MIAKVELFFDTLLLPLCWLPDFCLEALEKVLAALLVFVIVLFVTKIAKALKG